jgi:hypothetical protein
LGQEISIKLYVTETSCLWWNTVISLVSTSLMHHIIHSNINQIIFYQETHWWASSYLYMISIKLTFKHVLKKKRILCGELCPLYWFHNLEFVSTHILPGVSMISLCTCILCQVKQNGVFLHWLYTLFTCVTNSLPVLSENLCTCDNHLSLIFYIMIKYIHFESVCWRQILCPSLIYMYMYTILLLPQF